ncbi:hypothetical protein HanPSC8_Chr16g0721001 [Helianthus annuus]|nr:hypothetical protein HanPSC8_Chr16g0721001 [Helianthus annuus]
MFASQTEITNLTARVEELTKSKADFEERYEAAKVHRERAEKNQVRVASICAEQINEIERLNNLLSVQEELKQQLVSKDRDMAGKDVENAELKHPLRESQGKAESLEIDLEAEKQKAETADEARKVTQVALDIAQDNYAEVQSTFEPLVNNLEWLQQYGVAHAANAVLNSIELDQSVAALTVATRHMGHRDGYIECVSHVEAMLKVKWDDRH